VPEDTVHTDDVDDVTEVVPSPVVLTKGTKVPPTTATPGPGIFVIVGVDGLAASIENICGLPSPAV
jgi:hypothetical protein